MGIEAGNQGGLASAGTFALRIGNTVQSLAGLSLISLHSGIYRVFEYL